MSLLTMDELNEGERIVYEHMIPTPQIAWPLLAARTGAEVWVKHENHTPIGAFKVRGGLVYLTRLREAQPDVAGVISATRGNHGQSLGLAARTLGMRCVVVVPKGNSQDKNAAMQAFGVELVEHGDDFDEAYAYAMDRADAEGLHPVRSFHPDLAKGVGTYALELFRAVPDLDTVYAPIGQGSGICGLISARDALGLSTKIVGVVPEKAAAYALSFAKGKPVATDSADTIADGMACRVPDGLGLAVILEGAERIIQVSEDEILAAMRHYITDTHNLAEGAGAAPLAGLLQEKDAMAGKKVGLILSGGNLDRSILRKVLEGEGGAS